MFNMYKLYILNGPDKGKSFDLTEDLIYVGRSTDNQVQIQDKTVSRRHLRIKREGGKYFITDLRSHNGTLFEGNLIAPGIELELKEGVPIVLGMSVICVGTDCMEIVAPFLDSIELTEESGEQSGIFKVHKDKTNQKKLELVYQVSDILKREGDIIIILEDVLDQIYEILHGVDRAYIVLVDPDSLVPKEIVSRFNVTGFKAKTDLCKEVVDRVLVEKEPVLISDANNEVDDLADTLKILRIKSVMCVPLMGSSQIVGVLYIATLHKPYGFRKEDLSLFNDLAGRTALTIEHAWLNSQI